MNIANKLFSNPVVISILIVAIMVLMTLPLILQLDKSYKWIYYGCFVLANTLLITSILIMHQCCCKSEKMFGGSTPTTDFSNIFDISTPFNQF